MCSPIEFLGNKGQGKIMEPLDFIGEPGGIRTHDPMIKSHVLYRLSYGLTCHIDSLGNLSGQKRFLREIKREASARGLQ